MSFMYLPSQASLGLSVDVQNQWWKLPWNHQQLKTIKTKILDLQFCHSCKFTCVHSQGKIRKVTHIENTQTKTITSGVICTRPKVCSKFYRNCSIGLKSDTKQSSLTGIDHIRILGSGPELACNGSSCRENHLKEINFIGRNVWLIGWEESKSVWFLL